MSSNLNDAVSVPAALSAFLRGVERRGALFAELQCGDREAGDTALAAAMRAFRNHAGTLPMADWPRRFWTLLVATPQLRHPAPTAQWPVGTETLSGLQSLPRQALLLRLVAGLPEEEAATVLSIDPQAHEHALATACPRDANGQPDALAWRALAETIQLLLRDLPPQRLARLARLREAAITGTRIEPAAVPGFLAPGVPPRRRRWPWIVAVLAVCAVALAATWWWPQWRGSPDAGANLDSVVRRLQDRVEIESEDIPEQAPAAKFTASDALLTHRDFELLLEPQDEAIAREADFLAWYAAGAGTASAATDENAEQQPPSQATGTETTDAQF
ncbi:MAG: hypothetical protein ABWY48_10505 [Pseudoxanthomonas sp.]